MKIYNWRGQTSALMTVLLLSGATLPILSARSASAQLFPSQRFPSSSPTRNTSSPTSVVIPTGTRIPVEYEEAEKILVKPDETVPLTLTVAANIRNRQRTLLIPYGSKIVGQLEPAGTGSRFVAKELIINDSRREFINATSETVTRRETIKEGMDTSRVLTRAAMGAAAAAAISLVTGGEIGVGKLILGAGIGALGTILVDGQDSVEVISINPNRDLDVTLNGSLALRN